MKKIIEIISIFFLIITCASAKTYYSDYSDYSDYYLDEVLESDLTSVEKTKFYHAYEEVKKTELIDDLTYTMKDDSIIEYGDYYDDLSLLDGIHKYQVCEIYTYNKYKDYNYVYFNNNGIDLVLDEIAFIDKKNDIYVTLLKDFFIRSGDTFLIDILDLFDFSKTSINNMSIYIKVNSKYSDYKLKISINNERYPNGKELTLDEISYKNNLSFEYHYSDFEKIDALFEERESITNFCNEHFNGRILNTNKLYRNYKIFNNEEKVYKEYLDLYLEESKKYLLDYEDYICKYRYKIRNKVDIKDNIIIDSYDIDLKDYIEYSSIDLNDIKITSNINLYTNGVYTVNFILPFKVVTQSATVDIKENYINLINRQDKIIEEIDIKMQEAVYKVDKKNIEIKDIIKSTQTEIKNLKEEVYTCKSKLYGKESISLNKRENYFKKIWIILVFIILLILFVILNIVEKRKVKTKSSFVDNE